MTADRVLGPPKEERGEGIDTLETVFHLGRAINGLKHICSLGEDAFIPREAVSRRISFTHCSVFVKKPRRPATRSGDCQQLPVGKT